MRLAVVRAMVPLMAEFETLSMAGIARSAGVGEDELLAVFPDKEAAAQAFVETFTRAWAEVTDPVGELRAMSGIGVELPLAARLVAVAEILDGYHERLRVDVGELLASVPVADGSGGRAEDLRAFGASAQLREAVVRVLEPDGRRLRFPVPALAEVFVAMVFGGVRPLPADQVVDLFLHGALAAGQGSAPDPAIG
ncbi:TetR family transcriptional regulator [Actinoplanes ianthinogenes]|uniref:TetR family transcriptional regulator n=1 Tax=Actinoplanes ianthinogenes TaxID=122358 RepID=A0ABM7M8X8_9ACTN|nr:TetR family transcriptional regulator [Actinoplanes ianthinogenes]GGR06397.1 TetR family transcriptional regulator [Actinoplanes ianthinogenes]